MRVSEIPATEMVALQSDPVATAPGTDLNARRVRSPTVREGYHCLEKRPANTCL